MAELANNGTLFLDEIGELPLGLQAKLLQLVQEKTFLPIGGKELKHVDIRILTATNRNLETLVKEKKFREDLYFRLNVIEVTVPPLREDIPLLISYFLSNLNAKYKAYTTIAPEAVKILEDYHWPCNIRELEHVLERLVLIADDDVFGPDSLPAAIKKKKTQSAPVTPTKSNASYKEMEIEQILNLYQKLRSSYKVAEELHISQSKATRIINKYLKNNHPPA